MKNNQDGATKQGSRPCQRVVDSRSGAADFQTEPMSAPDHSEQAFRYTCGEPTVVARIIPSRVDAEGLIRPAEVRRLLGISRTTEWRWERLGILPPKFQISSRTVAYRREDIRRFVEALPPAREGTSASDFATLESNSIERRHVTRAGTTVPKRRAANPKALHHLS